jgi:hypothetical protein
MLLPAPMPAPTHVKQTQEAPRKSQKVHSTHALSCCRSTTAKAFQNLDALLFADLPKLVLTRASFRKLGIAISGHQNAPVLLSRVCLQRPSQIHQGQWIPSTDLRFHSICSQDHDRSSTQIPGCVDVGFYPIRTEDMNRAPRCTSQRVEKRHVL